MGDLVEVLRLTQPQVSKHLRVLREVGLVRARSEGRRRIYRLDARPLEPIHEWLRGYERIWEARFSQLDDVLEDLEGQEGGT